jgi:hypothetical protein
MTAVPLDLGALERALSRDPEFVLHSRYLTASIRVVIGDVQSFRILVRAGKVVEIDPVVSPFDSFDIQLAGTEEQWRALLAPIPPPFYQDFYPAMLHHGFRVEGDMETIMAYYPALRRLGEVFRAVAGSAVAS